MEDEDSAFIRAWRPSAAYCYIAICLFDFIFGPAMVMILNTFFHGNLATWQSLTSSSGGLVHLSFGAILGVTAYGRTQEKLQSQQITINGQQVVK